MRIIKFWTSLVFLFLARSIYAGPEATAMAWFDLHKEQPSQLRQFLQIMPKGADLHTHLTGAVYAETYIAIAKDLDFCVDNASYRLHPSPCQDNGNEIPVRQISQDLYERMVDRYSTRNLDLSSRSGHDQFFESFSFIGAVAGQRKAHPVMISEVANRAAKQNVILLELSISLEGKALQNLSAGLGDINTDSLGEIRSKLLQSGIMELVNSGRANLDRAEGEYKNYMRCDKPDADQGCSVIIRYILQTNRNSSPSQVYAQLVYAFELAKADPRVVGVGFVSPEDGNTAINDYDLHMQMIGYLHKTSPQVQITLHAGELVPGLAKPEGLRNHISSAVQIGGANRIGHGVDLLYEDNAFNTLTYMKSHGVAAEICLTSNDIILNVRGNQSPLKTYLNAGVPVVLASDDEGVSRIDLTHEYLRAATEHKLTYAQLKQLSRNSLTWSFLSGPSIWEDPDSKKITSSCKNDREGRKLISKGCQQFLNSSEKARAQWRLEEAFVEFESMPQWRQR